MHDSHRDKALVALLRGAYGESHSFEEQTIPIVQPGEALIHLQYTGLCHGDVHSRNGGGPAPAVAIRPLIAGHEGVGRVVALGCDGGEDGIGPGSMMDDFSVGDVVGIAWRRSVCGQCDACSSGDENFCSSQQVNGVHVDGTFRQYISHPVLQLHKIPNGIELPSVCPILCAGVTAYSALKHLHPKPGRWCVIFGAAGGVGHLAVQYARVAFNLKVVAVDGGTKDKEQLCRRLRCEEYVDFRKAGSTLGNEVTTKTEGGAHYALILSPQQTAWNLVGDCLRYQGKVMAVGIGAASMPLRPVLLKNISVHASQTGTKQDMQEALGYAAKGVVASEVEVLPMADIDSGLDRVQMGMTTGKLVVDLGDSTNVL